MHFYIKCYANLVPTIEMNVIVIQMFTSEMIRFHFMNLTTNHFKYVFIKKITLHSNHFKHIALCISSESLFTKCKK